MPSNWSGRPGTHAARANQERELRATREKVEALQEVAKLQSRQTRLFALLAVVALLFLAAAALAAWQYRRASARTSELLAQTGVQQAMSLDRAGRSDRAMAFLAHALRQDGRNAVTRGLVLDALLHRDWPLPLARFRHERAVTSAQFDAEGQRLLTASEDGTVRLWDLRTGGPLGPPLGHGKGVRVLFARFFQGDADAVLTLADDGAARVWRWREAPGAGPPPPGHARRHGPP